nr:histidine kinase [uncultured Novosphingobium sp.]
MDDPHFRPTPILRERRRGRCAHVTLMDSQGRPIDVIVRNVSSRGLSAAAAGQPPACNEVVRAAMDDGRELWGLVRWVDGNLFGVEFDIRP